MKGGVLKMKKFLAIMVTILMVLSLALTIGCQKKEEAPVPAPETAPAPAPAPEPAPAPGTEPAPAPGTEPAPAPAPESK